MDPAQRDQFKQAVFRYEPFPADWPSEFAIITACDPEGRVTAAAANVAADAELAAELRSAGYALHRVTGEGGCPGSGGSVVGDGAVVSTKVEEVGDRVVDGEKSLVSVKRGPSYAS